MTGALVYLQFTSLKNAVGQRVGRLRQPRYLIATLIGFAYFYFFFFRRLSYGPGAHGGPGVAPASFGLLIGLSLAALVMAGRIVYSWIFSQERAALAFSEAEVAFLFQAPVSRRTLVHFKLLKSQLRIVFSALLFTLISNRFGAIGGNGWTHAAGWWILLSTLELHAIGASFARERLLNFGLNPARRRVLLGGAFALVAAGTWWWLRRTIPAPAAADLAGPVAIVHYFGRVLAAPPLSWLLAPCFWVLRPFFAPDLGAFLRALGPALLVLAAHYWWVIRADVAFEEASIELSRRRAERVATIRGGGGWRGRQQPTRRRREPFALRPRGPAPLAFLWRNLISAGPWFYPRNWMLLSAGVLGVMFWLAADPAYRTVMAVVQGAVLPVGIWVLIAGPMLMRREVRLMMQRLDVVKTYPLHGWQVVLGEILAPMVLITAAEWLLLAMAAVATGALTGKYASTALLGGLGLAGAGLLVPPVVGLMIGIPFAATLYFPTWISVASQGGGIDTMGQRLIFAGGYLVVLVVALLPAALAAAVPYFIILWLVEAQAAALLAGAVAASLVLTGELAATVWWLGGRYERFDLSAELPQ